MFAASDPAAVDLPGFDGSPRSPMALRADAARLDDGVLAVDDVDVPAWWLPATPGIPESAMFAQMMEYRHPVFFS